MLSSYRIVIRIHHTVQYQFAVNWKHNGLFLFLTFSQRWNSLSCFFDAKYICQRYLWWVNEDRHPYLPILPCRVASAITVVLFYCHQVGKRRQSRLAISYYFFLFLHTIQFAAGIYVERIDIEKHQPHEFWILCEYTTNAQNGSEEIYRHWHTLEKKHKEKERMNGVFELMFKHCNHCQLICVRCKHYSHWISFR